MIELLIVPVLSKAGEAGDRTVGSYVICRSYEITPSPLTSPVVIGTTTRPGDGVTAGNETGTPARLFRVSRGSTNSDAP